MDKVKIGISACLLGEKVRYDGGHQLDPFLVNTLGAFVEYIPVCPEVEAGFPVPREAFRLVGDAQAPRLVMQKSKTDVTERMQTWTAQRLDALATEGLCGFIFKSHSPSSGMERVKVYNSSGIAVKKGVGIFARAFMSRFPHLPVEEEGRLQDSLLRENFIERVFTYWRWQRLLASGPNLAKLVEFHSRHKLLLMAHHPQRLREMGRWVAQAKHLPAADLFRSYLELLMGALAVKATMKKHVNVLRHMMGYFKKRLNGDEKIELLKAIAEYQHQDVPLLVPLTLLKHYIRKYRQPYLQEQYYLHPHPLELRLRNHS